MYLLSQPRPLSPKFWLVMSMATIVGGVTAYPTNYFLMSEGVKHGGMTIHPYASRKGQPPAEAAEGP
jgi:hypothetical protein